MVCLGEFTALALVAVASEFFSFPRFVNIKPSGLERNMALAFARVVVRFVESPRNVLIFLPPVLFEGGAEKHSYDSEQTSSSSLRT